VITSLPAAQEARMAHTRVEEKRGAGIIVGAMERNPDGNGDSAAAPAFRISGDAEEE